MRYTTLLFLFSLSFSLTSCSSGDDGDEPTNPTPTESTRIPLIVEVEEQPVVDATAAREGMTRTGITYLQNLTQFSMDFYKDEDRSGHYDFSKNNNQWTTKVNDQTWPGSETGVYPFCFYAYTSTGSDDSPFHGGDGDPYISVLVDENAFEQKDVLVAKSAEFSGPQDSPVRLTFNHICAAVGFTIKKKTDINLKVTSIVLHNVYNSGDYYYSKGWRDVQINDSKRNYYTITHSDMVIKTYRQELTDNNNNPFYLFMIPQTQQANGTEGPYLEVNCIKGDSDTKTVKLPFGIEWQAGYRYYIDIELQ